MRVFLRNAVFLVTLCLVLRIGVSFGSQGENRALWLLGCGLLVGAVAGALAFTVFRRLQGRGVRDMTYSEAKALARQLIDNQQEKTHHTMPIYFGGIHVPDEAATQHFMIVGTTGSGKTLTLCMMMGSVLPDISRVPDQRAVIFDVKQDMVSILYGMGFSEQQVCILNPFDRRCYEWNIAADVQGPDIALQVAAILIPEEESQNRYFSDAARDLLAGVMNVFIEKAKERQQQQPGSKPAWRLADVIYATRSPERLQHVLNQTEEGQDLVALHLAGGSNTTRSIISTIRTRLAPFEVIAAMWSQAGAQGRRISLKAFLKGNGILVMGNNQEAITPIQAINRVIFQRLTELLLNQQESQTRRTWFFLDEIRKLGKLDGLDDLMTNGRSKGACVVLGFQDIDGLRAVYGKEIAGELTSMCGSFGVLKVSGASTPQWASEIFGEQEVLQTTRNSSTSSTAQGGSFSSGESEQIRERKLYLPSQFRMLPLPKVGQPLYGYFCSSILGSKPYRAEIPSPEVGKMLYPKADPNANFLPWENDECKKLPVWGAADYARLNLAPFVAAVSGGITPGVGGGGLQPTANAAPPSGFAPGKSPIASNGNAALFDPFASPQNQPTS